MESGFSLVYLTTHHYMEKLTLSTLQKDFRGDSNNVLYVVQNERKIHK